MKSLSRNEKIAVTVGIILALAIFVFGFVSFQMSALFGGGGEVPVELSAE